MIKLIPIDGDDPAFLELSQRVLNGALAALGSRETFLVQVDNWFDHKWLGWWSWECNDLCIPPFNPNRIRSQRHFICSTDSDRWIEDDTAKPLHVRIPGRSDLAQPLESVSPSAAFIWYSGNTIVNKAGCLMFYLSGAERYSWYASFKKNDTWRISDELRVTRAELCSFEERGRLLVS